MKRITLTLLLSAIVSFAFSQSCELKVYNYTTNWIKARGFYGSGCGAVAPTNWVPVAPGGSFTYIPSNSGNPSLDWYGIQAVEMGTSNYVAAPMQPGICSGVTPCGPQNSVGLVADWISCCQVDIHP